MRGGALFRSGEAVQTTGARPKERCCVTWLSAGPELAAFLPGRRRAGPGQSNRGERSGHRGWGACRGDRGIGAAFYALGKGGENDTVAELGVCCGLPPVRAEQFFRRAGLRCPAGVRACSFYFLRALRGPFHKTKPAFARKTGSVSGSEPGTTKETSWPVRGR